MLKTEIYLEKKQLEVMEKIRLAKEVGAGDEVLEKLEKELIALNL